MSGILVTGASSGIGRALAIAYAAPGVTLGLVGRDRARLEETAAMARGCGAQALVLVADVTDAEALARAMTDFDTVAPMTLVFANAGVSSGDDAHILNVNLMGVVHTIETAAGLMRPRRTGRIAIMGSLAGALPLPFAAAYSASKMAVEAYGAALRAPLSRHGIGVTIISPGFVESLMSARVEGPKPFLMRAEHAAAIIKRRLAVNPARIAFPWPLTWLAALAARLPRGFQQWALKPFAFTVRD